MVAYTRVSIDTENAVWSRDEVEICDSSLMKSERGRKMDCKRVKASLLCKFCEKMFMKRKRFKVAPAA